MEEVDTRMPLMAHKKMEVIPAQDEMTQAFLIYWNQLWDNWTGGTSRGIGNPALYIKIYLEAKEEFTKYWKLAHDKEQRTI